MIRAVFFKDAQDGRLRGFSCSGHADYAKRGKDILCSAVSALTLSCVYSITELTGDTAEVKEADGNLQCMVSIPVSPESELLLKSLYLGISSIAEEYPRNVTVTVNSLFD
jgi:uncharacterized protein YsxB (DUF464 family)